MEGKLPQSQAQVQGQKQNRKAQSNPKVQNPSEKDTQKVKTDSKKKQASRQSHDSAKCELNGALKVNPKTKAKVKATTTALSENTTEEAKQENSLEDKPHTKQAETVAPKGDKSKALGSLTNVQEVKSSDMDGSGAEDGYTVIPKKRKAKSNSPKAEEKANTMKLSMTPPSPKSPNLPQSLEKLKVSSEDQKGSKVESPKSASESEKWPLGTGPGKPGTGHIQEKASSPNLDQSSPTKEPSPKITTTIPVTPKEEAGSLVKCPPVCSVSNSTASQITYASKLKQNLYRAESPPTPPGSVSETEFSSAPLAAVPLPPAVSGPSIVGYDDSRVQVPISATTNVINPLDIPKMPEKRVSEGSKQISPLKDCLIKHPSPIPKPEVPKMNPNCPTARPSLFTCLSNTQPPRDLPPQTQIQMLKEIFLNEWGLSFISDPSNNLETPQEVEADPQPSQPSLPPKDAQVQASQDIEESANVAKIDTFSQIYNLNKWLNPDAVENIPEAAEGELSIEKEVLGAETTVPESMPLTPHVPEVGLVVQPGPSNFLLMQEDLESQETLVSTTETEESEDSSPISLCQEATLEQEDKQDPFDPFDFQAAVEFHMAEMVSVWKQYEQDPPKVIIYDEAMDNSVQ